jgi:predicted restriction endonuclease
MAKKQKKLIRKQFRDSVFERDGYKCVFCGQSDTTESPLDAHHIVDRTLMPNGGYVIENGITVCEMHHLICEQFHITGTSVAGFSPEELYVRIGSSYEKALAASEELE